MQGKTTSVRASDAVYVGIDVCKAWLDAYVHPTGQNFRVPNSKEGIRQLRKELADASGPDIGWRVKKPPNERSRPMVERFGSPPL